MDNCYSCHSHTARNSKADSTWTLGQECSRAATVARRSCRGSPRQATCSRRSGMGRISPRCRPRASFRRSDRRLPKMGCHRCVRSANRRPSNEKRAGDGLGIPTAAQSSISAGEAGRLAAKRDRSLCPGVLEERNLSPAPDADHRTLIRRLTFDLIGLPPTFAEVEAFTKDKSPHALDDLVDRLLASPHFGERWARHWLDVVALRRYQGLCVHGGPQLSGSVHLSRLGDPSVQ